MLKSVDLGKDVFNMAEDGVVIYIIRFRLTTQQFFLNTGQICCTYEEVGFHVAERLIVHVTTCLRQLCQLFLIPNDPSLNRFTLSSL